MTIIAIVHAVWLLLLPLGLYCCFRGLQRRGFLVAGAVVLLVSLPAVWFCKHFWPFDFLVPARPRILAKGELGGWKIQLCQEPGADFYATFFLVVSPQGQTNQIIYDADDSKWWRAESSIQSNRIYFFRGSAKADSTPSYLDVERQAFWSGYYRREESVTNSAPRY